MRSEPFLSWGESPHLTLRQSALIFKHVTNQGYNEVITCWSHSQGPVVESKGGSFVLNEVQSDRSMTGDRHAHDLQLAALWLAS